MARKVGGTRLFAYSFCARQFKKTACGLTVCVTCVWAGVDNAWEQGKLEARKMLENAAESHTSGAPLEN